MITLKPLPYAYDALEPIISRQTLDVHYNKHHKGYVNKLIDALQGVDFDLMTILAECRQMLKNGTSAEKTRFQYIWNNAAQHYNHEFYWESLSPQTQTISADILQLINVSFGSIESFMIEFAKVSNAIFGSGWAWLTIDNNKLLHIQATSNAELPEYKPLLVLDVWEHAYYLDYKNDRSAYIKQILQHLNWKKVQERLYA